MWPLSAAAVIDARPGSLSAACSTATAAREQAMEIDRVRRVRRKRRGMEHLHAELAARTQKGGRAQRAQREINEADNDKDPRALSIHRAGSREDFASCFKSAGQLTMTLTCTGAAAPAY